MDVGRMKRPSPVLSRVENQHRRLFAPATLGGRVGNMRHWPRRGIVLVVLALIAAVVGASGAQADTVGADCVEPLDLISWPQDLSSCNLKGVTISANFALRVSNLSGANLKDATISGTAALEMSNLEGANLKDATISGFLALGGPNPAMTANLSGANLSGATISGLGALPTANLSGANLNEATISGFAALANANLSGANLRGATVTGPFALQGATYSNTTCPDGTNSYDNGGTCVGHGVP